MNFLGPICACSGSDERRATGKGPEHARLTHVADDSGGPLVVLDAADRERRAVEEARGVAARARVHERELRRGCEAQADDGEEKEEGVEQRWHLSCSAEVSEVNSCWTILELSLAHLDQS